MQIENVEYSKIMSPLGEGVRVIFTYDEAPSCDLFDIIGEPETTLVLDMIKSAPDPIYLLAALRKMTNVTVH